MGPAGFACWDDDGDGVPDVNEDDNEDGVFDAKDCLGTSEDTTLRIELEVGPRLVVLSGPWDAHALGMGCVRVRFSDPTDHVFFLGAHGCGGGSAPWHSKSWGSVGGHVGLEPIRGLLLSVQAEYYQAGERPPPSRDWLKGVLVGIQAEVKPLELAYGKPTGWLEEWRNRAFSVQGELDLGAAWYYANPNLVVGFSFYLWFGFPPF